MTKNELFEFANRKGHEVIYQKFTENDAFSVEINGKCYIGLNHQLSETEETELLSHELGHCEYAGFYNVSTPLNTRGRIEYRAKKWQYNQLVPLEELRSEIAHGLTTPWELAEHFNVSEPFLQAACEYYINAFGSIF